MRKIILVIIMTITFSTAFGQYLKLENFQAESLPSTWTLSQQSTATWNIAHSTVLDSNAAHVSPSSTTQNEKLTSPQVDLYNANSPVLRFKYIATKNTDFSILVSYNEGMHSKEIWNSKNVSNLDATKVNNEEISLEGYLGEYINIVLLYKGGDEVYIDDISISEHEYEDINDRYCYFNTIPKTEPITFVGLNEIQNRRTNEAGQKSVYYFLDQKANVAKDQSYPIYLEGDTNGNKVNSFTIFIDWDQDGYFTSENEVYFVGTYSNSTGSHGTQLVGNINVPNNAKLGETRIRIVKLASDNSSFYACGSGNYNGQVQDYTLVVNDFEFCSPTITSVSPITSVKVKDFENSSTSSSESVENFKNLSINLEQSGSEILEIKGNTNGNNTYAVTAFFDWNNDGIFSSDEIYQIGTINNSNGNDNISAKKQINIPQNAKLGKITARIVMTKGNDYFTNICNLSTDGQIEDYTVEILTGSCIKATTNEGIENSHANVSKSTIANDFKIEPNHSFN
ncbi:GEVED domain-containing protein [Chishuiella sp.]|uniref:GEVED domain-containing protein n=1 Tax=Chishuiella sp. TaxID=1969467 RepID=UPI0028A86B93|nr:GEVED domain-containing protein [Chishuiella sp.]